MLNQIPLLFTILLQQAVPSGGPPPPKLGPISPPGDPVPIDGSIWLLLLVAIVIAGVKFYSIWKSSKPVAS